MQQLSRLINLFNTALFKKQRLHNVSIRFRNDRPRLSRIDASQPLKFAAFGYILIQFKARDSLGGIGINAIEKFKQRKMNNE